MFQVLVGMIASGKSTYAKDVARRGGVIVNDDAVVTAVHGGDYGLYDERLKPLYKGVEAQIAVLAVAIGRDVVVDRGVNIRRSARARWVTFAKALDQKCEAVVFQRSAAAIHAARRQASDPRGHHPGYWLHVALHHEKDYDEPNVDEGFDRIVYVPWEKQA